MHADLISHYSGLVILHKITKFSPQKKIKNKKIMRMDKVKCGKNNFSCIFTCTHNFDFILCSLSLQEDRICHMKLCVLSIQVELSHIYKMINVHTNEVFFFFLKEFQLMISTSDDSYL